jgi:hypothetical protein
MALSCPFASKTGRVDAQGYITTRAEDSRGEVVVRAIGAAETCQEAHLRFYPAMTSFFPWLACPAGVKTWCAFEVLSGILSISKTMFFT